MTTYGEEFRNYLFDVLREQAGARGLFERWVDGTAFVCSMCKASLDHVRGEDVEESDEVLCLDCCARETR